MTSSLRRWPTFLLLLTMAALWVLSSRPARTTSIYCVVTNSPALLNFGDVSVSGASDTAQIDGIDQILTVYASANRMRPTIASLAFASLIDMDIFVSPHVGSIIQHAAHSKDSDNMIAAAFFKSECRAPGVTP